MYGISTAKLKITSRFQRVVSVIVGRFSTRRAGRRIGIATFGASRHMERQREPVQPPVQRMSLRYAVTPTSGQPSKRLGFPYETYDWR